MNLHEWHAQGDVSLMAKENLHHLSLKSILPCTQIQSFSNNEE